MVQDQKVKVTDEFLPLSDKGFWRAVTGNSEEENKEVRNGS